jgi:4-hydroxy-3-methylbut-2-enyl diphosphate reductase
MKVTLVRPRGFCAGVVRAIDIVNIALQKFPHPIYVRKGRYFHRQPPGGARG